MSIQSAITMKKQIPLLLLSTLLLTGCSSSPSTTSSAQSTARSETKHSVKTSTSKATLPVHTLCTSQEDGVTLNVELEAPAKDQEVTNATVSLHINYKVVGQLAGLDNLDASAIKSILPSMEDLAKNIFGSYLGVDPSSFALSTDDTGIFLSLSTTKMKELKKILDLDDDDSMVFQNLVHEFENDEEMMCS